MPKKSLSLENRIRQNWEKLSSHEQQLADVLLAAPGQLAMNTATELAESANVSKATTSRFFRHLGYDSYDEARRQAREMQNSGSPLYLQALSRDSSIDNIVQSHLEKEIANLVNTYRLIDHQQLDDMATAIAKARRVVVLGWRHSYSIATVIYRDLINLHQDVRLLPRTGDSLAEHLAALDSQDVAICVGLRRRMSILDSAMGALEELGVPMIYITDSLSGKSVKHANWIIRCHTESSMMFDSTASLSGVCNLLTSLVGQKVEKNGKDLLSRIELAHQWIDELS
ncbi:MurR/RpiR family transcriptional regulator [Vibrio olivae]|uniref:MurR/RpiR family transcriptional regulator n=1 Tax=Vibrio olivae TaxID=1243002 RepID=A0ABV5HM61_9VIBR